MKTIAKHSYFKTREYDPSDVASRLVNHLRMSDKAFTTTHTLWRDQKSKASLNSSRRRPTKLGMGRSLRISAAGIETLFTQNSY